MWTLCSMFTEIVCHVTKSLIMHLITVLDCVWLFWYWLMKHDKVCKLSHDWFPVLTFTSMLEGKCPEAGCGVMKAFWFFIWIYFISVFLLFKKKKTDSNIIPVTPDCYSSTRCQMQKSLDVCHHCMTYLMEFTCFWLFICYFHN